MTTAISLQYALVLVVSLAVYGAADALGAPRWLAMLVAGLACAAAAGLPPLLKRLWAARRADKPAARPDPRQFGAALAARVRLFAADRELGERGLYCVLACPGVDTAVLLSAAEFAREPLPQPDGPTWSLWRRRGTLLLEIPAAYFDEAQDAAWQTTLDVLPRRLLRAWTRGALLVTPWTTLETAESAAIDRWAELARGRLRAWARRLGLALPVHITIVSAGDPPLAPLLTPPVRAARTRPWGFRLPFSTDSATCHGAVAAEFEALAAALATRVVEDLGAPVDVHKDMPGKTARPRDLLPLLPRLRRLAEPSARFVAGLLAGTPSLHTIWPRGVFLAGGAPLAFAEGLFAEILPTDADLASPHAGVLRRRRSLLCAAGLGLSACIAGLGLAGLAVDRRNHDLLGELKKASQSLPIAPGPLAPSQLKALRDLDDRLAAFRPWPPPLPSLATVTGLRSALGTAHAQAVQHALFLPTLELARSRLCSERTEPRTDAEAAELDALLQFYVLSTWVHVPGKGSQRGSAAELELGRDAARRDAVVAAGSEAAWRRDPTLSSTARADIIDLLVAHLPVVLRSARLQPHRDESCVRQARERLQAWRDRACSVAGLVDLVPDRHSLRQLLQSSHIDALARPDDIAIAAAYTTGGLVALVRAFDDPRLRCGPGGAAFGHGLADDLATAEASRRDLFTRYAETYIGEWERLLGELAPLEPPRGCEDAAILLRRLAASDGPLRKLPDALAAVAVPPAPETPDQAWHRAPEAAIRSTLRAYVETGQARGDEKPAIDGVLRGLDKLRDLLTAGDSVPPRERDARFLEARTLADNACSLIDPKAAGLLQRLVQPLYDLAFRCLDSSPPTLDPWCAEVAAPFARGLGDAYPFDPDARRDAQLPDLCAFYCPQGGAAWKYYNARLASVLLAAGNGRFVANDDPGFLSFRSYNPALVPFYGRTWQLSNLLFPFGDAPQPALRLSVYIPPIDLPGVKVEEIRLVVDGQALAFTNARERWRDLTWPGETNARTGPETTLSVTGRYHGQPFSEQLHERGTWALFRLLERADEATWSGDHLRFRFTFAALHGLAVDLELDAGLANELLLDRKGRRLAAFRSPNTAPTLQLRRKGPRCPL